MVGRLGKEKYASPRKGFIEKGKACWHKCVLMRQGKGVKRGLDAKGGGGGDEVLGKAQHCARL